MSRGHMFAAEGRAKDTGSVLRRLLPYLRPFRTELTLVGGLVLLNTLADLAGPYLIGLAVDEFITPGGARSALWLRTLVPMGSSRLVGLGTLMALLFVSYALTFGLSIGQFRILVGVSQRVLLRMRSQILEQVQTLSLSFFDGHEAGDLMSRLVNDTQIINQMFGEGFMRLLRMTTSMVGIVISMLLLNWRLSLAAYSLLPLVALATMYFARRARTAFRATRQTIGQVSAELQENIAGVREVQAFSREEQTLSEFQAINERNRSANVEADTLTSLFMPILEIISTMATAVVLGVGGYLALGFTPPLASVGIIVSFLNYTRRFYNPIRELANLYGQMQAALAGAERIFELLDEEPLISDAPDADELETIEGRITFRDVTFRYVEDEPVLDHVSFEIEPGQTVAIVGPTGAGKSTIVNLLLRLYDPQEGSVLIDGRDVRHLTRNSLRQAIGIVPQDTFLFSDSLMENIRYGRLDATDEDVIAAATMANVATFVSRLPEGYETELGERGSRLSQGNRQLVAIARAILKDPRVLVLDEATSSVDTRTEVLIQRALERLMSNRTSLVIAHRLSTIRHADVILVIDGGQIVERGTHDELLAAKGAYHDLYMSQFRLQEEAGEGAGSASVSDYGSRAP